MNPLMSSTHDNPRQFRTLIDVVQWRAQHQPDNIAFCFLADGEVESASLTYRELDLRARSIANRLKQACPLGDRVLLLYPPGLEFIAGFLGCLYAGVVAVPLYAPRWNRDDARLERVAGDCQPTVAFTTREIVRALPSPDRLPSALRAIPFWSTDDIPTSEEPFAHGNVSEDLLAFLQYTSGSTSAPRGVMVSHRNLMTNMRMAHQAFELSEQTRMVSWLPVHHDMGLIGNTLCPLFSGFTCVQMPPASFLQQPLRWLRAISKYRATCIGAPNFAYELCTQKAAELEMTGIDLSFVDLAYCGSEPIRPDTLKRFRDRFAPHGFRWEAFYPCYGLAETTLLVSGGAKSAAPATIRVSTEGLHQQSAQQVDDETAPTVSLVGCGRQILDEQIRIVDPEVCSSCEEGRVGEIWVSGDHVAGGYWNNPDESAQTFGATIAGEPGQTYLRTGDLGFLRDGELFVTGRRKDLVIIRGRNHYPQDIELTAERSHPAIRSGKSAAFSVDHSSGEELVIVSEVEREFRNDDLSGVVQAIRRDVAGHHELSPSAIVLIRPFTIPTTTSGKIQRGRTRNAFLASDLEVIYSWDQTATESIGNPLPLASSPSRIKDSPRRPGEVLAWLRNRLAPRFGCAPGDIDPDTALAEFGLDSRTAVELSGDLQDWIGTLLPPTLVYEHPTLRLLADHLGMLANGGSSRVAGTSFAETSSVAVPTQNRKPIAIVGVGCRFPGAHGPAQLWSELVKGFDAVGQIPEPRRALAGDAAERFETCGPGARFGGFITGVETFDPAFFGIHPREACHMDPQQRLLLEVAWEALADAGIPESRLAGTQTGVFVGIASDDYGRMQIDDPAQTDLYTATGSALSIAANRISYLLRLEGPSLAIDTACSSSLVAVDLACKSLWEGSSQMALVGGVNLLLSPQVTANLEESGFLAPDGRCKAFSADANGYGRGEGAALVVLKPLHQAQVDGDSIYAVIRGSATNHSGHSNGLTAPRPAAQAAVLRAAYHNALVDPKDVDYIEAHGTGTQLGDPIEIQALAEVLSPGRHPDQRCRIGSIKTNIGHLEAAAGIAGLIKTALMLRHGQFVPSLHCAQPNPLIPFDTLPIHVQQRVEEWPSNQRRLAGVSSFGFGGTNAHVVLESSPHIPSVNETKTNVAPEVTTPELFTLSAHSPDALQGLAVEMREWLLAAQSNGAEVTLSDVCDTARVRREHRKNRLTAVVDSLSDLAEQLDSPNTAGGSVLPADKRILVFVYSGQGPQWWGMGRELMANEPDFRKAMEQCEAAFAPHLDWSLLAELSRPETGSRLMQTEFAQPALFAVQFALTKLWASWGVRPQVVIGHSLGEVAAFVAAGCLSLEEAAELVALRGKLSQSAHGLGNMAAIPLAPEAIAQHLKAHQVKLTIAARNGPESTVVSGDAGEIERFVTLPEIAALNWRMIPGSVPFHSPFMSDAANELQRRLSDLTLRAGQIPIYSTVTGKLFADEEADAEYWTENLRMPVQFDSAISEAMAAGGHVFVEVSPHPVLIQAILAGSSDRAEAPIALPSLRRQAPEKSTLLATLATLFRTGILNDLTGLSPIRGKVVPLPAFCWQRERFWLDTLHEEQRQSQRVRLWRSVTEKAHQQSQEGPINLAIDSYPNRWRLLEQLTLCSMREVLKRWDAWQTVDQPETVQAVCKRAGVIPKYHPLFNRWIENLVRAGILRQLPAAETESAPGYGLAENAPASPPVSPEDFRQVFADSPQVGEYFQNCAASLTEVLTGQLNPLELLFPDQSFAIAEQLYEFWPVARYFNNILRSAVEARLGQHASRRTLRVLEVGAGIGGTTTGILSVLPTDRAKYVFTDLSLQFLNRARQKYHHHPHVEFGLLDLERPPSEQGYPAQGFDIVVATNVLHATRDLRLTLQNVRSLLKNDGFLLINEVTRNQPWLDITVALIEGWGHFEDELRSDSPLLTTDRWMSLLAEEEFGPAQAFPPADSPADIFGQHVLIAQRAGPVTLEPQAALAGTGSYRLDANTSQDSESESLFDKDALRSLPNERRLTYLTEYLQKRLAFVFGLKPERLDVERPLHEFGLDSMLSVEIKNRVAKELGCQISVSDLLRNGSVTWIATEALKSLDQTDSQSPSSTRSTAPNVPGTLPLASPQRWMWAMHALDEQSPWCNIPACFELQGSLDVTSLEQALRTLVKRHEMLRASVELQSDGPVLRIDPQVKFDLEVRDLTALPESERKAKAVAAVAEDCQRPFDISKAPLLRATLYRLANDHFLFSLTTHHLATDGWSMRLLMQELAACYAAPQHREAEPPKNRYSDYMRWEHDWLGSEDFAGQLEYWKQLLAPPLPILEVPTDHPRIGGEQFEGASLEREVPSALISSLTQFVRSEGATEFMLQLAAFQVLLRHYTGQQDVIVGTFASTRNKPEFRDVIGCFVNHLVVRNQLSGDQSFRQVLQQTRETLLDVYARQDVPFEKILSALQIRREAHRSPIFQVAFGHDQLLSIELAGINAEFIATQHQQSNFDVTLRLRDHSSGKACLLEYNAKLFERQTMERFLDCYLNVLQQLVNAPDQRVSEVNFFGASDRMLLDAWNGDGPPAAAKIGRSSEPDLGKLVQGKLKSIRRRRGPQN